MKALKSILFGILVFAGAATVTAAQVIIRIQPNADQPPTQQANEREYDALVNEVFAPIGHELSLTNDQKLKVAAVISKLVLTSDPLMDELDDLDDQVLDAVMLNSLDEAKIAELSGHEAFLIRQVVAMKARAKADLFKVLTPEQRAMMSRQFKRPVEANVGSISNE